MTGDTDDDNQEASHPSTDAGSGSQVRGSSLLLGGQVVSMGINYLTQILIIRHLAMSDYGAFAYALSLVLVLQAVIQLGLDRGLSRYLPIYDERSDVGSMIGALSFAGGVTAGLGLMMAATFWFAGGFVSELLAIDPLATSVLAILIVLAPIEGLDNLLVSAFAALHKTRAIFLRRHVVAPLLKLGVVTILIARNDDVEFLAIGYAAAGVLGFSIFAIALWRMIAERRAQYSRVRVPIRELVTFSLPLLTTDLVFVVMTSSDALMLEWFGTTSDVAAVRAVQPTAKLGHTVLMAFGMLYVPYIARLYERGDLTELGRRYWHSVNWVVVLSLPLVSLTLMFSAELTGDLLGAEYRDSAIILGVLTTGYFTNGLFGFNGMTLNVYHRIRQLVVLNVVAMAANIGLNLALIPRFGPLGAAIGTAGTYLVHNAAKQFHLLRLEGFTGPPRETTRLYVAVAAVLVVSGVMGFVVDVGFFWRLAILIAIGLAVLAIARSMLRLDEAFPALARAPVLRHLFK